MNTKSGKKIEDSFVGYIQGIHGFAARSHFFHFLNVLNEAGMVSQLKEMSIEDFANLCGFSIDDLKMNQGHDGIEKLLKASIAAVSHKRP